MKLLIISGRSGAGKNTVLHSLEDEGFICIDNFPASMIKDLINNNKNNVSKKGIAVCIDSRNDSAHLQNIHTYLHEIDESIDTEIIFIDAISDVLIKRFSETRRKHPLTNDQTDLRQAVDLESKKLAEISDIASLRIDTSNLTPSELINLIRARVVSREGSGISMLFCSFGFRNGVPIDADYVFDLRCLPNPFYEKKLKSLSGTAPEVRTFLNNHDIVNEMFSDIINLIRARVVSREGSGISMLFCSFGFRNGVPIDADYVFDLRCLPNPFYEKKLKSLSGTAPEVRAFLNNHDIVNEMFSDIVSLLENWVPHFDRARRYYITVALGCTGGRHRSVYMAERLAEYFNPKHRHVIVRHRDNLHDL